MICHRQGGLGEEGEAVSVCGRHEGFRILDGFDQRHDALGNLAEGADDFWMTPVPDECDVPTGIRLPLRLAMDLGDQRASGVEKVETARLRILGHSLGHAMGGEDDGAVVGNLVQFLDEDGALRAQAVDHIFIMDDLVPDIDGRAIFGDRALHDGDGAVHPRAKAARRGD